MKNYLFILIVFFISIVYSSAQTDVRDPDYYPNKFNFQLQYSQANFYNINGKPVSFNGITWGSYLNFDSFLKPIYLGVTYYYPKNYEGQLILLSVFDTLYPKEKLLNAPVTGSGLALELSFNILARKLSYTSKSEDFCIYPQIGFTALAHTITFNNNDISYDRLSYWCTNLEGLTIGTINLGFFSRFRIANFPLCLKVSQNINIGTNNYSSKIKIKRNYSSYLNIGIGFTFPITKGPGVSKIKTIHYK